MEQKVEKPSRHHLDKVVKMNNTSNGTNSHHEQLIRYNEKSIMWQSGQKIYNRCNNGYISNNEETLDESKLQDTLKNIRPIFKSAKIMKAKWSMDARGRHALNSSYRCQGKLAKGDDLHVVL